MLLTFTINKQLIKRTDCEIPVAKSENYLYAQFSFSDEWVGTKTAIFNNGTAYSVILDEDNKCLVPWEVITESGFSVSVYCGERITANISFVKVLPTGYIEGQTPADPTPTVYEQIIDALNKKLEALNIKAGQNVTVDIDGNDVTINASGGGGSSFTVDDTLSFVNSVLSVAFAQETQSGLENGKAVRSNEFNTAMNTISTTFGNFVSQLNGKQNAFAVGKGLTLSNSVLSADVRRWLFVEELPFTDIDQNAVYLMLNSRVFPSISNLIEYTIVNEQTVPQRAAVTYDEGVGYRFIKFWTTDTQTGNVVPFTSDTFYTSSGARSLIWEMYITDGVTWTKSTESAEGGDKLWCTTMDWTTSQVGAAYTNVVYANTDFRYIAAYKHWNTDNNTTRIDGTIINTSTLPPYEYMASQYDGTSWQDLGVFDFEQLFAKVETEIASKADSATTYTKTEVDTAINETIGDAMIQILGGSV